MSRYRRVWVVYRKELIETLRDRRTLIAMVVVPLVLYPVLMVVLIEALRTETSRRQAEHYSICVPSEAHRLWLETVLQRDDDERAADLAAYREAAEAAGEKVEDLDNGLRAYLQAEHVTIDVRSGESLWDLVEQQKYHAGLVLEPPPDPENPADATNRIAQIIYCDTDPRSEFVFGQLSRILHNESDRVVRTRVSQLAGGDALLSPLATSSLSTASPERQFAKIIAMVVPFLLVTMTVTGAMYPAIDLTAGERERGTLETLAVSPVPVGQIVAGKFGVIVSIAMIITTLNLGSMTAMVHFSGLDRLASSAQSSGQVESLVTQEMISKAAAPQLSAISSQPSSQYSQYRYLQQRRQLEQEAEQKVGFLTTAAPVVLLAMIPFAVLFGGVMLAACSFARTFKEAQNYMMPVMMAAIIPAMVVSYMPTIKLEGVILVIPVANVVVLMRELFLGQYDLPAMAICLLSTCLYAVTAVAVAAKLYGHEAVLFSDVGSYKTLLRRRFFQPRVYPSVPSALLTVAVLFPVNFYWQSYLVGLDSSVTWFRAVISAAQVFIFAAPAVLLCWYLKVGLRQTFSLRLPGLLPSIGTLLLAFSVIPMSHLMQQIQFSFFPPAAMPDEIAGLQEEWFMSGSLTGILLVFAVLPGICEELLFRGFLMAGLRRKLATLPLVVVVGLVFGLYHVSSEKIPVVSLSGMLLAFVCLRSGSIFPAMVLHIAINGLALASARVGELGHFLGLSETEAELTSVQFDLRTAAFLAVFLIGLALVAAGRGGSHARVPGNGPAA
ncbi:MAG: CPBP family intramembrane metalloprotease [Phycisphaerae bacterium]|nr:CPBP family intramembrane metalloprotease [Phycisphaerae bacterium]